MRVELRNARPAGARTRAGSTLPLAVLLTVLVVAAAGIAGTAHFSGARWVPHLGVGKNTTHVTVPTTPLQRAPATKRPAKPGTIAVPLWLELLVAVAVAIGIGVLLLRLWGRRRAPAAPGLHAATVGATQATAPTQPDPEPEALLTGIALALEVLEEDRDPADAVVRAWLGLQETAEESGIVRSPSETPSEFAARVLSSAFADDQALRTLLRLYLRTRFGDHPVTPDDVVAVRDALQRLLGNWRATKSATTPAVR